MKYLLDSNIISDLYNIESKQHENISKRLIQLTDRAKIAISIVTLFELEYACHNAPESKTVNIRNAINHIKKNFGIIPLSSKNAELFGKLKKQFKDANMINKENIKKHNIDIMLASSAICGNYVLISADKIYPRLKQLNDNLHLEDWTNQQEKTL